MSGWAALAQVGSDLFQGWMADERQKELISAQQQMASDQFQRNADLQKQFAQTGIQWRVEDAKRAGVHPMYALGAGGAAFAPPALVMPEMGQGGGAHYGRAMSGAVNALVSYFAESNKEKDEVIKAGALSNAALARSHATAFPGYPETMDAELAGFSMPRHGSSNLDLQNAVDVSQFTPQKHLSVRPGDGSLTAGPAAAGGTVFQISPSFKMILPSVQGGGASEALESISESMELAQLWIQRNVDEFGESWLDEAQKYLPISGTLAKVLRNIRNASTWVGPTFTEMGHRIGDWIQERRENQRELRSFRQKQDRALAERFRRNNPHRR